MLRFSGSSQNPGSSVLDELQLSNGLLWKAGEETRAATNDYFYFD